MPVEAQILAALAVDLAIGDPRLPVHPVRLMGGAAALIERITRRMVPNARAAGGVTAVLVPGFCLAAAWLVLYAGGLVGGWLRALLAVWLIYSSIACMDLLRHAFRVYNALEKNDLNGARKKLGMMVGRNTQGLDSPGVVRATVESVAEGLVDGVTAPLFYAVLFGPLGAVAYRAVNTLDSMFGYRYGSYARFGWASARLDDLLNWVPARLTAALLWALAVSTRRVKPAATAVLMRQARAHNSPNAGWPQAAVAAALGIRLGGTTVYAHGEVAKPVLGTGQHVPEPPHILAANLWVLLVVALFTALAMAARIALVYWWL